MTIEELYHRYTSYQYSYCKLVIELGRRRQYKEAAQKIVEGMMAQLDAMTEGKPRPVAIYSRSPLTASLRGTRAER